MKFQVCCPDYDDEHWIEVDAFDAECAAVDAAKQTCRFDPECAEDFQKGSVVLIVRHYRHPNDLVEQRFKVSMEMRPVFRAREEPAGG